MLKHQLSITLILCSVFALPLFPLLGSAQADVFNVKYVAPGYIATDFVTLPVNTAAIELDEAGNIYTSDSEFGSGTRLVTIYKFTAASDYTSHEAYASYSIDASGINGLSFDESGNLFVTEFDRVKDNNGEDTVDSGYIRKIDSNGTAGSAKETYYMDNSDEVDIRPTGIEAIEDGHLFFPGRKWTDPDFGNLYEILNFDSYVPPLNPQSDIIREGVVLTALTMDAFGNFFGGTPSPDNSIYTHDPVTNNLTKVASFNQYVEELSYWQGNLYVLEDRDDLTDKEASIIQISSGGIDIKPGSFPNCFNQNGHGVIPVAVFGSETFDVNQIDVETLSLQGLNVKVVGNSSKALASAEYVNDDDYIDLVIQFEDSDGWIEPGNGYVMLQGEFVDGSRFWAGDSICIVPSE